MKQIYFVLTERCNLNCVHCIRGINKENKDVALNEAIKLIDILYDKFPESALILTGGEPTLHNDFRKILINSAKKFKKVVVTSNATTKYYEEIGEHENYSNCIFQISLDGDEKTHDAIRGIGNFKKSIMAIMNLIHRDFKVEISTTVNELNYLSLKCLYELLVKIGVKKWYVNNELQFGSAYEYGLNPLNIELWNKLTSVMQLNCTDIKLKMSKMFNFEDIRIDAIKNSNNTCYNCGSGNEKIYIYPNFNVYGCTCLKDFSFGNLKNENIDTILNSENYHKISMYKVRDDSPCKKCDYLSLCNGGCIGMSYNISKGLGFGDIRCPIVKAHYSNIKGD